MNEHMSIDQVIAKLESHQIRFNKFFDSVNERLFSADGRTSIMEDLLKFKNELEPLIAEVDNQLNDCIDRLNNKYTPFMDKRVDLLREIRGKLKAQLVVVHLARAGSMLGGG